MIMDALFAKDLKTLHSSRDRLEYQTGSLATSKKFTLS